MLPRSDSWRKQVSSARALPANTFVSMGFGRIICFSPASRTAFRRRRQPWGRHELVGISLRRWRVVGKKPSDLNGAGELGGGARRVARGGADGERRHAVRLLARLQRGIVRQFALVDEPLHELVHRCHAGGYAAALADTIGA